LQRWDGNLSVLRGALAAAALGLSWWVFKRHAASPAVLLVPLAAFVAVMVVHEQLARRRQRVARAIALYVRAIARLDGSWDGQPEDGARFLDAHQPFAADLDLFGAHSLFQLLCTARTAEGEATLARWLTEPAAPNEIRARQAAVDDLRARLDLREALWIAGRDVRATVDANLLAAWGSAPPALRGMKTLRPALLGLSLLMAILGIGWLSGQLAAAPAGIIAALVLAVTQALNRRTSEIVDAVARPDAHLALLAELIRLFERELETARPPVESTRLRALRDQLRVDGRSASKEIARLGRLVRLLEWQRNLVFAPVGYALLWRPQLGAAIEAWRQRSGPHIASWLRALSELEALSALATLAYDHPARPFPTIAEPGTGPVFVATGLRHPLLPGCIPNDVALGGSPEKSSVAVSQAGPRLMVLSGSNMSGKSTLMRTVGVNAVLALAGAPVDAESLVLSPLVLGATLRIQDSLVAGTSRFYAEVTRLRQLVDLARGPTPLLFLIDEILAGTNSHDRRLGASAVLRGLVELGAIGIASTHDLALTAVVEQMPGRALNYHFEDRLDGGQLTFDYRLRTGVVQRSNALALMRAVGLDV
jgi:hypothetical protein